MAACDAFPNCSRSGCGLHACDHAQQAPPSIPGVCMGYIGWPDCHACGRRSWDHDERAPHGIEASEPTCAGYDPGEEFQGQGGGYGGGGASGGW